MALLVRISAVFYLLALVSQGTYAQVSADTTIFRIKWLPFRTLIVNGKEKQVLSFRGAIHHKRNNYLPHYSHSFDGKHIENATFVDAVWEEYSGQSGFDLSLTPSDAVIKISNDWSQREPHSLLTFYPIRKNPFTGRVEMLVKF